MPAAHQSKTINTNAAANFLRIIAYLLSSFYPRRARFCHSRARGCRLRGIPRLRYLTSRPALANACGTPDQLALALPGFFARQTRARMTNTERILFPLTGRLPAGPVPAPMDSPGPTSRRVPDRD